MTDTIAFLSTYTQFLYTRIAGQTMAKWHFIFITLVLVSGIFAAGCLGEGTSASVPAAIKPQGNLQPGQVLQVFGDVTGLGIPRGTVDTITFTVGLAPDIKTLDMEKLVIVYADAIRTETLSHIAGFRGDPPAGEWGILSVQKEVGTPNNRIEYEEQFVIRVNPKAPIVPNQVITIILKTPNGTPTSIRRIIPTTIMAENLLPPI
jgi:archaellin